MKKLCLGSFISVLTRCAAQATKQKNLVGAMLASINPDYEISTDDRTTSALANGRANVSGNISTCLDDRVPTEISDYFRSRIFPMLDMNKKETIVHALRDIIADDTEIRDDCEIEVVNHHTKAQLLTMNSIVFADFLAGLFLYTLRVPSNINRETSVKEITAEYIRSFDKRRNEITFLNSYELDSTVCSDPRIIRLSAESGGCCPRCGGPLQQDAFRIVRLSSGEEMIFCNECAGIVEKSDTENARMQEIKQKQHKKLEVSDAIKDDRITEDIRDLIMQIATDEPTYEQKLRMSPLKLEKKLSDRLLLRQVKSYISDGMYEMVNDVMEGLSAAGKINLKRFSRAIKHMYKDCETVFENDQSAIFNTLVDRLHNHSGMKNREACAILISYFVQSCEVFDEIAG